MSARTPKLSKHDQKMRKEFLLSQERKFIRDTQKRLKIMETSDLIKNVEKRLSKNIQKGAYYRKINGGSDLDEGDAELKCHNARMKCRTEIGLLIKSCRRANAKLEADERDFTLNEHEIQLIHMKVAANKIMFKAKIDQNLHDLKALYRANADDAAAKTLRLQQEVDKFFK
jgi:hypothetical protein